MYRECRATLSNEHLSQHSFTVIGNSRKSSAIPILASVFWAASMRMAAAAGSQIEEIIWNTIDLVELITVLVWTIALVVFGWGVVKFIASAGNPEKLKEARGTIWWGVIGMFVLASIYGIIVLLQKYFGVGGSGGITPPLF